MAHCNLCCVISSHLLLLSPFPTRSLSSHLTKYGIKRNRYLAACSFSLRHDNGGSSRLSSYLSTSWFSMLPFAVSYSLVFESRAVHQVAGARPEDFRLQQTRTEPSGCGRGSADRPRSSGNLRQGNGEALRQGIAPSSCEFIMNAPYLAVSSETS